MAKFCSKCGAETGGRSFCIRCGAPVQPSAAQAVPPAAAPVPAPAVQPARGGSALKIILITLVLLIGIAIAGAIGAAIYIKHRVHDGIARLKQRTGIESLGADSVSSRSSASLLARDGCLLLSRENAQGILGFPLVRAEGLNNTSTQEHCDYYAGADATANARNATAERFNALKNGHAAPGGEAAKVEDFVKGITASVNDGSAPILQITVYRGDAKTATSAMNVAGALMGTKPESVSGPWDDAVFGPMNSTLTMRKGDNGVMIDLRQIAHGRQIGLELAKAIAPQL